MDIYELDYGKRTKNGLEKTSGTTFCQSLVHKLRYMNYGGSWTEIISVQDILEIFYCLIAVRNISAASF